MYAFGKNALAEQRTRRRQRQPSSLIGEVDFMASRPASGKKPRAPLHGSTTAMQGSHHSFGQAAPFGSGTARCSPSATFAHMLPNHRNPHITPTTTGSGVPKHRLPNRKWEPPELQGVHHDENMATSTNLANLATPLSDRLSEGRTCACGEEGTPSIAASTLSARSSSASLRSAAAAERRARPPSAREEQQRSRALRQEISLLRDEKLRSGSQPSTPRGSQPSTPRGSSPLSTQPPVALRELEARSTPRGDDPLERLGRVRRQEHSEPSEGARANRDEHVMTVERASLLSFIAGEVRTR